MEDEQYIFDEQGNGECLICGCDTSREDIEDEGRKHWNNCPKLEDDEDRSDYYRED